LTLYDKDPESAEQRLISGYVDLGWKLLRLHRETKRPVGNEWQLKPGLSRDGAMAAIRREQPIGVQVGEVSGWIAVVDCDTPEAVRLAPHFLPATLAAGKGGARSHYFYRASGLGYAPFDDLDQTRIIDLKASSNGRGHHVVVAPSRHPTKGPYEWLPAFDPGAIADVEARQLRRAVGQLAAAALIGRHLREKGRHRYSLALAGYLLRGGLSAGEATKILQGAWTCRGAPQEGVDAVARNVADTAAKIARDEPAIGGRTLRELVPGMPERLARFLGWRRVVEDEGSEANHPTNRLLSGRMDLGRVMAQGIAPPDELEPDILLEGKIHHVFGPSEAGKTIVALWMVKRRVEARQHVVVFDAENGPRTIAERLGQMGVDASLVSECLVYLPFPDLTVGKRGRQEFYELLDEIRPVLIVFDSWASFLASAGYSENENSEIEAWDTAITKPTKQRGIASVILDHVPHDLDRSRGGARKKEVADVQWRVRKTQNFDRDSVGEVLLVRHKDRSGWLPPSVTFSVGGRFGDLICQRSAGTVEDPDARTGLTTKEQTVLTTLIEEFLGGARMNEWQEATHARDVGRTTHFRTVKKLVSEEVPPSHRVVLVDGTYFPPVGTEPPKNDGTSKNRGNKPDSPRSHEVPNRYHGTNGTSADGSVPSGSPPLKGGPVEPPRGTPPAKLGDVSGDYSEYRRESVSDLFSNPPAWFTKQLAVYRENPRRHFEALCSLVAAAVHGDPLRAGEVSREVRKEVGR
jgi:hypothetical protein